MILQALCLPPETLNRKHVNEGPGLCNHHVSVMNPAETPKFLNLRSENPIRPCLIETRLRSPGAWDIIKRLHTYSLYDLGHSRLKG